MHFYFESKKTAALLKLKNAVDYLINAQFK